MKRKKKQTISNQARLATVVTTSALSLTLLSTMQNTLQAQDNAERRRIDAPTNQLTDEQAATKFLDLDYNYCDAKVLASFWKLKDVYEAKVTMGHKLWNFDGDATDAIVREARAQALAKADDNLPAWLNDGGYTYDDAEMLGGYWGADVWESKVTMSRLLIGGHDKVIKAALKSARH